MAEKAKFSLKKRNPDVLTCIANLSNDEVFTPPEFAKQMLDTLEKAWADANNGANIWADKTVKFLDPCTKSGVFLREIVERLTAGLESQIPNLQKRVDHILTKQVFGIGITHLTSLLARRSVYCSKFANGEHSVATSFDDEDGHIWFKPMQHTWVGGNQIVETADENGNPVQRKVNGRCKYCAATQETYDRPLIAETYAYAFIHTENVQKTIEEIFGESMQFDVVIGNPPYQLGASGGNAVGGFAMPVYQKFVESAKGLDPRAIVMVTPARWYAGGRGLDEFRKEMLGDRKMRALVDFPDSQDCFPGVDIEGGVSYFLWDRDYSGKCEVTTFISGSQVGNTDLRFLDTYDVFIRRNEALPILEKVTLAMEKDGIEPLSNNVSPIQPFSIRTNFVGASSKVGLKKPIVVYGNKGKSWMQRSEVPRNDAWIDDWKVLLGRAYGMGKSAPYKVFNNPFVAEPGSVCTETYLVIDHFQTESEAKNLAEYLSSRFVRFLVSLKKNTQDIYSDRFSFVPSLPMSETWTDEKLYKKFSLTKAEVSFIESMIRPMEFDNE